MESPAAFWALGCFFIWMICAALGAYIGSQKQAGFLGAVLGFLFGPLGVLIACFVDQRSRCPFCRGRLDGEPMVCPHCQREIAYNCGAPMAPQAAEALRAAETARQLAEAVRWRAQAEEANRCRDDRRRKTIGRLRRLLRLPLDLANSLDLCLTRLLGRENLLLVIFAEILLGLLIGGALVWALPVWLF